VADEVALAAERLGARVARNPDADSPQVASLRAGLRALGAEVEAAVVTPVDVPRADAETVRALAAAFASAGAPVAQPFDGARHGHPVLFARGVWAELMADPLPDGARTVIHAHAAERAEVRVPTLGPRSGWSFLEMSRRSSDWMVVGVAAVVELDDDGTVAAGSVAFGGVAERPWPVPAEVLADLLGAAPEEALLQRVAERAAAMLHPDDDVHASGPYRRRLAAVLGRRALAEAAARARGDGGSAP